MEKDLLQELSKTSQGNELNSEDSSEEDEHQISDEEKNSWSEDNEKELESLMQEVEQSTSEGMGPKELSSNKPNILTSNPKCQIMEKLSHLSLSEEGVTNNAGDSQCSESAEKVGIVPELNSPFVHEDINEELLGASIKASSRYAPSSVASTIAPEVIKARVKASLEKRKRSQQTKRIRAKGDASGVTKQRRDNRDDIKASQDAFWADD